LLAAHPELAELVPGSPEPYDHWDRIYRGFRAPCRDLTARDVDAGVKQRAETWLAERQAATPGRRLLAKVTGWGRRDFLRAIWPEVRTVHVVRDGRAVAFSLMQQSWWRGWAGPTQWRWGPLTEAEQQTWEQAGRSFFVLAGYQWARCVASCEAAEITVRYEQLVAEPRATMVRVRAQLGLANDEVTFAINDRANWAWRDSLPRSEVEAFERVHGDALRYWGYESS
jgi:hypothetical protein